MIVKNTEKTLDVPSAMDREFNIINLGYNPWSPYWKRNQTIVYMLSKHSLCKSVLFINSDIWLENLIKMPKESLTGLSFFKSKYIFPVKINEKIEIFTQLQLPRWKILNFFRFLNKKYILNTIKKYYSRPFILIINDPQANKSILKILIQRSSVTIFDWSDDFTEFSSNPHERFACDETCKSYCLQSNFVITVNEKLRDRARLYNKNSFVVKNATNYFTFGKSQHKQIVKSKIDKLGQKVVGYIGWLNSLRLDLDLLEYVIESLPEIQFLFMGPKSEEEPLGFKIPKLANVHIFAPVPYLEYLAYLSSLTVCILPNKINLHTDGNDPIKIYDYLATGHPVVSTRTAGTGQFQDVIYWANDKYEFKEYLVQALEDLDNGARVTRCQIARRHSWQERYKEIGTILAPFIRGL